MSICTYIAKLKTTEDSLRFWKRRLQTAASAHDTCVQLITQNNVKLGLKEVHEAVYDTLRTSYPELPAQAVIKIYKSVISELRSIKSNKHEDAKTPIRKGLVLVLDKRLYSHLDINGINLSGANLGKRTHYDFEVYDKLSEMFSKHIPSDPTLFMKHDVLYLAIPFNVEDKPVTNNTCVGVDLGIRRLFVTSDGVAFRDNNYLKNKRKVRYLKRCLKAKGTKSARKHLRRLKHKERNMSKDMQNRAVNVLIKSTNAGTIVLENLKKLKKNTSKFANGANRKKHNNMISQVPFGEFKERLTHKAHLCGMEVKTVNPANTSKTDSRTGQKNGIRKGCRYYCKDKVVLDADWNAAVNIAKKSKLPCSNVLPKDGGLLFLCGRPLPAGQSYVNPA